VTGPGGTATWPFLLAQALDGLQLEQRFPVLRPVDVPLDADQVVESDDLDRPSTDGDRLGMGDQLVVAPDGLQVAEEVEGNSP
jgi:hypothetical protein